jgi:D-3-phosphoglycerate dehydrogenase / 2-oxoglutarate reductase
LLHPLIEAGYELVYAAPGQTPSESELMRLVQGCVGWIAGVEPIGRGVIAAGKELRAISRNGTGIDNIDLASARERKIQVLRAPAANARGVAELAIALAFAALRRLPVLSGSLKHGQWKRELGSEIGDKLLTVVGFGAIGRQVATMGLALDARVAIVDPFSSESVVRAVDSRLDFRELCNAVSDGDIISLHCPPSEDGSPLISAALLHRFKPGSILINTARANLVDEEAIIEALDRGQLSVFATDVFRVEPPSPSEFLAHPRVIATPHLGGYTRESIDRAAVAAVNNLLAALKESA